MSTQHTRFVVGALFILGLALHALLAFHSGFGGDQVHMLRGAVRLITTGTFEPFMHLLKGPGTNPGCFVAVLTALPIGLTHDYHAAMIVVLLEHLFSLWLLIRVASSIYGQQATLYVMILFWLNPFRLYNASIFWEPAFMTIGAVLHLFASYHLRNKARFWPSVWIGLSVVTSIQIHNSWLILFIATIILVWKKLIRLHYKGLVLGVMLASITLLPTFIALFRGDTLVFDDQQTVGYLGKGLVTVAPMLKSLVYCVGLGGFDVVRELKESHVAAASAFTWIITLQLLCVLSVVVSILANYWYYRPIIPERLRRTLKSVSDHATSSDEQWLRRYVLTIVMSLFFCAALAPSYLQGWQVVPAAPAMLFPVLAWAIKRYSVVFSRTRRSISTVAYVCAQCCVIVTIFLANATFNQGPGLPSAIDPVKHAALIPFVPSKQ